MTCGACQPTRKSYNDVPWDGLSSAIVAGFQNAPSLLSNEAREYHARATDQHDARRTLGRMGACATEAIHNAQYEKTT